VTILLDFETRSRADLKAIGGRNYAAHESTEVLCCVLHDTDSGEWATWTPGDPVPFDGRPQALAAHNAVGFDMHVYRRLGWPEPVEPWIDTSELARRAGLPGALDALGVRWLQRPKDKEGSRFTLSLSRPSRAKARLGQLPELTPETMARVTTYCRSDVEIMAHGWPMLEPWADMGELENATLALDRAMNERGIGFDVQLAARLLECDAHLADAVLEASAREARMTAEEVATIARSPKQFTEFTGAPDAQAETVEKLVDEPGEVGAIARARQALASIVKGKLEAGLARVSPDGRLRDSMRYYGAHAQPNSEPVRTPSGWTAMGALRVGDFVQGRSGSVRVIGVYPQGRRDVYRVTFSDGSWTRCDADHLWKVRTHRGEMQTLRLRDFGSLRYGKRHRYMVPLIADRAERADDVPIDPYTLGAFLGDGCMLGKCPRFTSNDPEIVGRFKLPGLRVVSRSVLGKRSTHYRFVINAANVTTCGHSGRAVRGLCVGCYYARVRSGEDLPPRRRNPLRVALERLGLWGRDSFTKFVPAVYMRASFAARVELLRGLFDTDGSAKSPGVVKYATCSPHLRDAVIELVQSIGGTARAYTEPLGEGVIYDVNCHMPVDVVPFTLTRKVQRWRGVRRAPWRAIVSVEPDGEEESTCIEVDTPDHLYVTRGYVVTHNTGRWSHRGLQPGNMPRPAKRFEKWTDVDICRRAEEVLAGAWCDAEELVLLLRACFVAREGHTFIVEDFSGVEARALAHAAEDFPALEVFRTGGKPYHIMAGRIFGCSPETITKGDPKYTTGKIAELACGYGMGGNKFEWTAAKAGVDLRAIGVDPFAVVAAWRELHRPIVRFWYAMQEAAMKAVDGYSSRVGLFEWTCNGEGDVALLLPSGRPIVYPEMHTVAGEKGPQLRFRGGKSGVEYTYGGKLVENAIQAECRDLLAGALVACERDGIEAVLSVHDEGVWEVPTSAVAEAREEIHARMTCVPEWCEGFPLGAEGFVGTRYRK
jgi:hypothetical protein